MNGIMYVSWLVGPVLQTTLLIFMIRRKLQVVFPRFFSYIVLQIVKSGILFLLSIVNAFSSQQTSADRVVSAVLAFDRSVRVMQCGLFFLLMILCRLLRNCWR